jgi:hypothetical protein
MVRFAERVMVERCPHQTIARDAASIDPRIVLTGSEATPDLSTTSAEITDAESSGSIARPWPQKFYER